MLFGAVPAWLGSMVLVLPNTQAVINEPMAAAMEAILMILTMVKQS
jgi:hypothetical protein